MKKSVTQFPGYLQYRVVVWMLLVLFPLCLFAEKEEGSVSIGKLFSSDDSVLVNIFNSVSQHAETVRQYQAQTYIRSQYKVHRRNVLIRMVPSMFKFYDGVSDYLTESVGEVQYVAPDVYHMKLRALSGTFRRNQVGLYNALEFLNVNVYSPTTLLPDKLISPFNQRAVKYYDYYLDSIMGSSDSPNYCIRIVPRNNGIQLVDGTVVVNSGTWLIRELTLHGRIDLVDFTLHVQMGEGEGSELLPARCDVNLMFRFLWNRIESDYSAFFSYDNLVLDGDEEKESFAPVSDEYDLTRQYLLKCDDSEVMYDTAYIAPFRPEPLDTTLQNMYADFNTLQQEQTLSTPLYKRRNRVFWGNVSDALTDSYTLDLNRLGHFHFSPILDLGMLSYSPSNGVSYKQQFNYYRLFKDNRLFKVSPKAGYNFTRKELYWSADLDFYYAPERLGAFTLKVGNGNRIYTSRIMDKLSQQRDTLVDFSKLNLNYFKDMYVQVGNRIEISNGLQLFTGIDVHRRKAVRPSELVVKDELQRPTSFFMQPTYITFAPRVKVVCTPGQYYYMDGLRKVYLHSNYPTFSFDYEHGLKGVMGSNGSYGRMEADIYQCIRLSSVSNLYYRYGGGVFTEQKGVYFVDFANFSRSNLPVGWEDEISGAFHLLDNDWYNSSRWYSRAHLTFEAPFIILPRMHRYQGVVHSERLYGSILYTTHLHPYVELGYGIGTYLFNLGIFTSNVNGQFHEVGCKFTFELFSGR